MPIHSGAPDAVGMSKPQSSSLVGRSRPHLRVIARPDPVDVTDGDLLALSAAGDRFAFDELVRRHAPRALRIAARLLPDAASAEDVVQEAMVRAWSGIGHFDPARAQFTTWLHRIVVNLCTDHRRRRSADPLPDDYDPADDRAGADETMEADQRHAALRDAVRRLPQKHRAVLTLVYDEGLSGAETGRVVGLSAKAVERLLARARSALRAQLAPQLDG